MHNSLNNGKMHDLNYSQNNASNISLETMLNHQESYGGIGGGFGKDRKKIGDMKNTGGLIHTDSRSIGYGNDEHSTIGTSRKHNG
jgi:hypothetical protein